MDPNNKPTASITFLGNVDSGKSTILGHLFYKCGGIAERDFQLLQLTAEEAGLASFSYAFFFDELQSERARCLTIINNTKPLFTSTNKLLMTSCPGHFSFLKNVLTAAPKSDQCFYVIPASIGEFEAAISPEVTSKLFSIVRQLKLKPIFIINKMDRVQYSQTRFEEIKRALAEFGLNEHVETIPVTGFYGENLTESSDKMPWYKGKTLIQALEESTSQLDLTSLPLRISIQDVFVEKGEGNTQTIYAQGDVIYGTLAVGAPVQFGYDRVLRKVIKIIIDRIEVESAEAGDTIELVFENIAETDIRRGDILSDPSHPAPKKAVSFTTEITLVGGGVSIQPGDGLTIDLLNSHKHCRFGELIRKIDLSTGETLQENPDHIETGDTAIVKMYPNSEMCVETFEDFPKLAKFAIRGGKQNEGCGIILSIDHAE